MFCETCITQGILDNEEPLIGNKSDNYAFKMCVPEMCFNS
jgi:hypothetical protein